jgi:hypothetical protein
MMEGENFLMFWVFSGKDDLHEASRDIFGAHESPDGCLH